MTFNKKQAIRENPMFGEFTRHTRMGLNHIGLTIRHFAKDMQKYSGLSFQDIYIMVHTDVLQLNKQGIKGIGVLGKYDIASAICRYHHINIDKIYIVGGGPKNALCKLNLTSKTHKLSSSISLPYVTIDEVKKSLQQLGQPLLESCNGDDYESHLCKWQKM